MVGVRETLVDTVLVCMSLTQAMVAMVSPLLRDVSGPGT